MFAWSWRGGQRESPYAGGQYHILPSFFGDGVSNRELLYEKALGEGFLLSVSQGSCVQYRKVGEDAETGPRSEFDVNSLGAQGTRNSGE